ncbi:HRDC domain-containing protein, partial [Klebsiella pneumoniae]
PVSMDGVDAGLLAALKAWRLDEARTQSVPAYVIMHDSTLVELARQRPDDLEGLADIPGFGARKVERYGDALVELISGFGH